MDFWFRCSAGQDFPQLYIHIPQIAEITALKQKHQVEINIEQSDRRNRITVEGCSESMIMCVAEVTKIIHTVRDASEQEHIAELIYQQVSLSLRGLWRNKDAYLIVLTNFNAFPKCNVFGRLFNVLLQHPRTI